MHNSDTPIKRSAQPLEPAVTYVHLASDPSCYITEQTLHVNSMMIIP